MTRHDGRLAKRLALILVAATVGAACASPVATAPPPPEGVVVDGEITVSLPRPLSLDPGNVLDRTGEIVVRTMCDPLLDVDRETGEFVPALLDSWVVTDAGTRLVLRLRSGLRFPDGSPVTTRDAVFGMSRAASADFAGENAGFLDGIQGADVLRGFVEPLEPRHRTEFSGIRILSDTAFEVNLNFGAQVVLPILTSPVAMPLSRVAAEQDPAAFDAAPVCVGPYVPVAPYDPASPTFTLERVANYPAVNEAYSGGGQGYVERITFHWTEPRPAAPDDSTRQVANPVGAGPSHDDHDIVELGPRTRGSALDDPSVLVATADSPFLEYVGIPDVLLPVEGRVALSQALDRAAIAEVALGGQGAAATTFLPPNVGSRLYDPDVCGGRTPRRGDVAAARATLEAAGISLAGRRIPLVTTPDFDNVRIANAIAFQWRRAFPELEVEVRTISWDDYALRLEDPTGFDTAFRMSRHVPFPTSADSWLRPFWSGSIGFTNAVGYSNIDLDELLNFETAEATDPVDQAVLHRQAEQIVCRDLPMIPVVRDVNHYAFDGNIASGTGNLDGLVDPITGGPRLREVDVTGG